MKIATAATIVLAILKLVGTINWSWWYIVLPLLATLLFDAILILAGIIISKKHGS